MQPDNAVTWEEIRNLEQKIWSYIFKPTAYRKRCLPVCNRQVREMFRRDEDGEEEEEKEEKEEKE